MFLTVPPGEKTNYLLWDKLGGDRAWKTQRQIQMDERSEKDVTVDKDK